MRFTCQKLQQARVLSAIRWMTSSLIAYIAYARRAVKLQELRDLRHELDSEVRDSIGKSDVSPVARTEAWTPSECRRSSIGPKQRRRRCSWQLKGQGIGRVLLSDSMSSSQ